VRGTAELSASVTFITVQFNNPDDTDRFVDSLSILQDAPGCSLVVVDNSTLAGCRVDAVTLEKRSSIPVEVISPGTNLYYWGAAARAIETLQKSVAMPEWIVICNNDVTIADPSLVRKIRSLEGAKCPIVAPRIVSSAGKEQNPLLETSPPFVKRLKWQLYDSDYRVARTMLAVNRFFRRTHHDAPKSTRSIEFARTVYAPHGAFLILSKEFFLRGGNLDTAVPMFAEELTIAVTAERLGMPVWYYPDLVVYHREHTTTGRDLTQSKYDFERRARKRYYALAKGKA
jgi:GT2 family glycosyltransferase